MRVFAVMVKLRWLALVLVAGCTAGSKVQYVDGQCLIDGLPATLSQVETRQAEVTQHILGRQPFLTAIAVAAVTIAAAGYLGRLRALLAARRDSVPFSEKLRARMERYRAHPVRYALLIAGVLGLLVAAGVTYVAFDADKRASERALANLQFCHLALRSAEEQHVLTEQREHLASIQATEHDIQALVDKLPPAEQQKAHEIVTQLSTSLGQQRSMVAQFAQRADVAAKALEDHQTQVEHGLSKLDTDIGDLKNLPVAIAKLAGDVHDNGTRAQALGGEIETCTAHVDNMAKTIDALSKQVDALAARPPPTCTCNAPVLKAVPPPVAAGSAAPPPPEAAPDAGT